MTSRAPGSLSDERRKSSPSGYSEFSGAGLTIGPCRVMRFALPVVSLLENGLSVQAAKAGGR
ncbi:hypothetical protein, partial [Nevskia soli]|uniref:hypothetical protein n=1 Tax=Nevskia soli TaxID=418856 RepID=UPI001B806A53